MKVAYLVAFLGVWIEAARAQETLPVSSPRAKQRRLKKKKGHQRAPPPQESADEEPEEYLPPITDGSEYDDDDPIVHVLLKIDELESNGFPSFMESSLSVEEKSFALEQQAASLDDDLTVDGVIAEIQSVAITCKKSKIEKLKKQKKVKYVEEDAFIHEDGNIYPDGETIPTGFAAARTSTYPSFPYKRKAPTASCSSRREFKVGVVDGGMDVGHWDFEWCGVNPITGEALPGKTVRCMGRHFTPVPATDPFEDWYNSKRDHGVHVTGTVAASGINGVGLAGLIPDEDVCVVAVRIFSNSGSARFSLLVEGVIYAANVGVKVLNMSLGTASNSETFLDAIRYAKSRGMILVGSAGNKGNTGPNYPASYPEVVGVAAVDNNKNRVSWSNFGSYINVAAPGAGLLSTVNRFEKTPYTVVQKATGGKPNLSGNLMVYTKYVGTVGIQGTLVDCGSGNSVCSAANGRICIMNESGASYYTKAQNCVNGGGIGLIIYNSNNEMLRGSMGENTISVPNTMGIPVVGVTNKDGNDLLDHAGKSTEFRLYNPLDENGLKEGYRKMSGTSMAAPMVTGTVAYMWRQCPGCSADDITTCLYSTAEDKGDPEKYGSGVIRGDLAFHCAVHLDCCPDGLASLTLDETQSPSSIPSGTPSSSPSTSPSKEPSSSPSSSPSSTPSKTPSSTPSMHPSVVPSAAPTTAQPSSRPSSKPTRTPSGHPSRFPSTTPSRRPSSRPSKIRSSSPSGNPTRIPSGFPTITSSASPSISLSPTLSTAPSIYEAPPSSNPSLSAEPSSRSSACLNSCNQQYSFCTFRTNQVCNDNACKGLCNAAVGSGELASSFLDDCQTNWCPGEVASCSSSSMVSCYFEKEACAVQC